MTLKTNDAALIVLLLLCAAVMPCNAQRQMEKLSRGLIALNEGGGKVFVSWRLLATDPSSTAFSRYRETGNGRAVKLDDAPLVTSTSFTDSAVNTGSAHTYFVRAVLDGKEGPASGTFVLPANA